MHESAIRDIPLCRLALAPENVRKTPPDEAAETQLRASIAEHDLLENLVVRPDEPDADGIERFAVVAGGRRLAALKALAENGTLHADHPVPCKIAANGNASELSLAENVVRIAMHPADQVVAFAGLADSGVTVPAIAARFGVSERTVEQRLRLGNAAPELLDAYRAEQFDLETLMAFAVTTDHDRQRSGLGAGVGAELPPRRLAGEAHADRGAGARRRGYGPLRRRRGLRGCRRPGAARPLRRRARERRVAGGPEAARRARHEEAPGGRRRALDPLEVGGGHGRGRLERHRALRAHPSRARRADRRREGRDRAAHRPPRRARQHGRGRVDGRAGRGGRSHRAAPRRDRGRGRIPRPVQARGFRDRRVHRHHRARRLAPGHPGAGEARRPAEGHRRRRERPRRRCR